MRPDNPIERDVDGEDVKREVKSTALKAELESLKDNGGSSKAKRMSECSRKMRTV
jgi:hypothetical protein